jgi:hypothetical protein
MDTITLYKVFQSAKFFCNASASYEMKVNEADYPSETRNGAEKTLTV